MRPIARVLWPIAVFVACERADLIVRTDAALPSASTSAAPAPHTLQHSVASHVGTELERCTDVTLITAIALPEQGRALLDERLRASHSDGQDIAARCKKHFRARAPLAKCLYLENVATDAGAVILDFVSHYYRAASLSNPRHKAACVQALGTWQEVPSDHPGAGVERFRQGTRKMIEDLEKATE